VDGLDLYAGCSGDCCDGPDNRWYVRVNDDVNGSWSDWTESEDQAGTGWRGFANFSWRNQNNTNASTLTVQMAGEEDDNAFCGDDDCEYPYSTIATENITNRPPCTWHNFTDFRGGTWGVEWRYRYEYDNLDPGSINGNQTICEGGNPSTLGNSSSATKWADYQWQSQTNCSGGWSNIGGANGSIYNPPGGLTQTRCYRRRADDCSGRTRYSNTVTVTVEQNSDAPSSASASNNNGCPGFSTTLTQSGGSLGTGAQWYWYSGSCGGTLEGTSSSPNASFNVSPSSTTTYYVRAEGNCNTTSCESVTVTVKTESSVPGSANASNTNPCPGDAITLTQNGGSLGTGADYVWYSGGCGGNFVGVGSGSNGSLTANPTTNTTYFVRAEGDCNNTSCASISINVKNASIPPSGISTTNNNFCPGGSATLSVNGGSLGPGASWQWYSGSCGLTSAGSSSSITVSPTSTTTYHVRAEGNCNNTSCESITITVKTESTPASSINANTDTLCVGSSTTLSVNGGSLGTGASWRWYTGSCSGNFSGTGGSLTVSPSSTTTYYVRAEGDCNNTACRNLTLTVSTGLAIDSFSVDDVTCNGGNDGEITTHVSGGLQPYSYNWNPGSGGATNTNLTAGNYNVTVTDAAGCNVSGGATVNEPPQINITNISTQNVDCNGESTGSITVVANGGTGSLEFSADNGASYQSSNVLTGLPAGNYNVKVRDANGCVISHNGNPVVITEPTALTTSIDTSEDASCGGVNDGNLLATAQGGTTPYQFSLNGSPFQPSGFFGNLSAGTYTVIVQDANGCQDTTSSVTIQNKNNVIVTLDSSKDVSCNGATDGYLSVSASGGTQPYSYSIDGFNFQASRNFDSLSSANYTVIAQDASGCTGNLQVTIGEPAPLTLTVDTVIDPACSGATAGEIYITASGGTPNYSYNWSNGSTNEDQTGLGAGTYTVTVTDTNGCTATASATINQPSQLNVSVASSSDISCNGGSDGSIDITVSGGTQPYNYNWSNGSSNEDISGLAAGTYTVTVTDDNGCTATLSETLTEPNPLTMTTTSTDVSCAGASDGSITVTNTTGGTPSYEYSIDGVTFQNGTNFTNLSGGIYNVIVRDSTGCTFVVKDTVAQPAPLNATIATQSGIQCNGSNAGSLTVNVNGGTPAYSYNWSTGASSQTISNLTAGTYYVTVTDTNNCTAIDSATIQQPAQLFLNVANKTDVTCNGYQNGKVDITINGGTPPYSYNWSSGDTTEDVVGLSAGTYTVTVTDANNCTLDTSISIDEPTSLSLSITGSDVTCYGAQDGSADLTVTGGTPPYDYFWSNFEFTQDIANLDGGNYTVVVTDSFGCQATDTVSISEPDSITIDANVQPPGCNGQVNGNITLDVTGGTSPYTYAWSTGASGDSLGGVGAGNYSVTVTDANGCVDSLDMTVGQPVKLSVTGQVTDVSCSGAADGSIDVNVSGGSTPYTFNWSHSSVNTEDVFGLSGGSYSVTVTDVNNCSQTRTFVVNEPSPVTVSGTTEPVTCNGANDGKVLITVNGGTTPYSYFWSTGSTNKNIVNVTAGSYSVTVTDDKNCSTVYTDTVTEPAPITVTDSVVDAGCNGSSDGAIYITVTGGVSDYSYQWSNGDTSQDLTNVTAGSYTVTVTDTNNCSVIHVNSISEPAPINVGSSDTNVTCYGAADGSIDLSVSGGVGGYSYSWNHGPSTQDVSNLPADNYNVTVTDSNGCSKTYSTTITQPDSLALNATTSTAGCVGDSNGVVDLNVLGGTTPYSYAWSNGETSEDLNNVPSGTYTVTVTDDQGCVDSLSATVDNFNQPVADFTFNTACEGAPVNFINQSSVSIGLLSYEWHFGDGSTTTSPNPSYTYATADTYTVTLIATTNQGCADTISKDVEVYPEPTADFTGTTECVDDSVSFTDASSIPTGGNLTYQWNFDDGSTSTQQNPSHQYNAAGTYQVTLTVTSDSGCTDQVTRNVVVQPAPDADFIAFTNCEGEATTFNNLSSITSSASLNDHWQFGDGDTSTVSSPSHVYDSSGSYSVTLITTSSQGCADTITKTISVDPAPSVSFDAPGVCIGDAVQFTNTTSISSGSVTQYNWSFGDGGSSTAANPSHTYDAQGTYSVTLVATSNEGCVNSVVDSVVINEQPNATISTGSGQGNYEICEGEQLSLNAPDALSSYQWSTGDTSSTINVDADGVYAVTVSNANGCNAVDSVNVTVHDLPPADAGEDTTISFGYPVELNGSGGLTYLWEPTESVAEPIEQNTIATPESSTIYTLTVTDSNGCVATDSVTITVERDYELDIYNVFTPNSDGKNDTWNVGNVLNYDGVQVRIFNRWGNEVYSNSNYQNEWDGTSNNGNELPDGTYYYVIQFEGADKTYRGSVTIMR